MLFAEIIMIIAISHEAASMVKQAHQKASMKGSPSDEMLMYGACRHVVSVQRQLNSRQPDGLIRLT